MSAVLDLPGITEDDWQDEALRRGWGDGLPLVAPTPARVEAALRALDGVELELGPLPPSGLVPTPESFAANCVMAGCRPADVPVVLAAVRALQAPEYNLHGVLATTHPCAPLVVVSGPVRTALRVNCGTNCFGQGTRANAVIGRAVQLVTTNIGGARPGSMDRSTQGGPAKYTFCFGENEEESPFEPYSARRGFAPGESVVTVAATEGPHNVNDHGGTSAEDLLLTISGVMAQPGSNNVYVKGPHFLVLGPEHAATLARDGWTVPALQQRLWEQARIPVAKVSANNRKQFEDWGVVPDGDAYTVSTGPEQLHVLVAGGAGKHSAWIPSFGATAAVSRAVPA
ncbi:hypothetical protein OF117_02905 [Geodermatophilus sp. YIM 151500]|uniref:hypothetical protein n=1 Tax=Geodermatophilus sp. YIM 151500 TaxID=2984531 RepID=UPI0021E45633|nr:hypothetical protein [Geodermatophilus sp. YIM 151500]MCV2488299.1 hypothetical protein [Geodermatophilus sp. YIM 151500]